jgi:fructose-1,6-bisphosphatase/inositol monophosphatase family enzyme
VTTEDIKQQVDLVQHICKDLRGLLVERAGKVTFTDKADTSPVTETDLEVENIILSRFSEHYPATAIFGEESGYDKNTHEEFWLIDPIDGTKAFLENVPTFTVMAVLISSGEAVASVIYNPSANVMFVAQLGHGAFRNGIKLDLRQTKMPRGALCKGLHIEALNKILESKEVNCEIAPDGGGYGFTMVAEGLAAARFQLHSRGQTHDYAPGALLVREAHGSIIATSGDYAYDTKSFVACHPGLAEVITEHLAEIRGLETTPTDS